MDSLTPSDCYYQQNACAFGGIAAGGGGVGAGAPSVSIASGLWTLGFDGVQLKPVNL